MSGLLTTSCRKGKGAHLHDELQPDSRPRPDPTLLTTSQLHREIEWVRELVQGHISSELVHLQERKDLFLKVLSTGDDLINERINGVLREMTLMSDAAKTAVAKSEAGYEKRFESVNEFRQQLGDQAGKFITSAESRALHKATEDKLTVLTDRFNKRDGQNRGEDVTKGDMRANITVIVAVAAGLASLFLFLSNLDHKVDRNTDYRMNQPQQSK